MLLWMACPAHAHPVTIMPVTDPAIRQRIIDECLVAYLHDDSDAWDLQADGVYVRAAAADPAQRHSAQAALMARYAASKNSER